MYENLVFAEFLKKNIDLKYWRTKSGAEIDFINKGEPIEIKTTAKTSKSLYSFIEKYSPKNCYIISEYEKDTIKRNNSEIKFIPFAKFV